MTVCDVCMTQQMNGAIMQHSMHKSTPFTPKTVTRQSETSVHHVQEGNTVIYQSHFVQNMSLNTKAMRLSCDCDCERQK